MLLGQSRGLPWWGAVLLAFGFAVVGKLVDLQLGFTADKLFQGAYFVGCVGAICLVRRRDLFAPMVQPPLILAITVPGVTLLAGPPTSGSLRNQILTLGTPLINGFPTMAITTVVTIAVGVFRIYSQRKPPQANQRKGPAPKAGAARTGAAKARPAGAAKPASGTAATAAKTGQAKRKPAGGAPQATRTARGGQAPKRESASGRPANDPAARSRPSQRGAAQERPAEQPPAAGRPARGRQRRSEAPRASTSRANDAANKARERARQIREDSTRAGDQPQRRRRMPTEDPEARRRRRQGE